jgi:hypothetical protein
MNKQQRGFMRRTLRLAGDEFVGLFARSSHYYFLMQSYRANGRLILVCF